MDLPEIHYESIKNRKEKTEMAVETKKVEKVKVLAGTFPAASGDWAHKLAAGLKAAKIEGFVVKPATNMPGYIQVVTECKDKAEADAIIKESAGKKFKLCIAK